MKLSHVIATLEPLVRNVRRRKKENPRKRKTVPVESRVFAGLGCAGKYGKNMLLIVTKNYLINQKQNARYSGALLAGRELHVT